MLCCGVGPALGALEAQAGLSLPSATCGESVELRNSSEHWMLLNIHLLMINKDKKI